MNSPEPLVEVRGLTVQYHRGRRRAPVTALSAVDITLLPGRTVSVVGESGSGKSTLGNAILGLVPPTAGTIRFRGEDITHLGTARRRELTQHVQAVFQNPQASLNPQRTIGQTLEEPLLAHRSMNRSQRRTEVATALTRVGLDAAAAARYPAHFSGGQLQRIAIARALMLSPSVIICDEAVSALDLSIQAQILNLLADLQRELGLTYLFISHDLAVVRHISDRVAVLYRGQLMETGTAADVCDRPAHPYTRALLAAAPVPDPAEQRGRTVQVAPSPALQAVASEAGCPYRPRCPHAIDKCAQPLPARQKPSGIVACHRYGELGQPAAPPADRAPENPPDHNPFPLAANPRSLT
jgi:oligopeptide/dipeptide ABC transporter ATP-binding protein